MNRLSLIISDLWLIFQKSHLSVLKRLRLLFLYLVVVFKRLLDGRLNIFDFSKQKVFGHRVYVDSYNSFYWTFREIFIHEDYYFRADNDEPYIIDCGGNTGIGLFYYKILYPKARILIFEPHPYNFELIKKNIKENSFKDVVAVNKAVAKEDGVIKFYGGDRAGTLSEEFATEKGKKKKSHFEDVIDVEAEKLSNYIEDDVVDFLKIDIEGAEVDVLQDLDIRNKFNLIKQVTVEYHFFSFERNRASEVLDILNKNKFYLVCIGTESSVTEAFLGKINRTCVPRNCTFMIIGKKKIGSS